MAVLLRRGPALGPEGGETHPSASVGAKLLRRGPALGPEGRIAEKAVTLVYGPLLRRGPALGPEGADSSARCLARGGFYGEVPRWDLKGVAGDRHPL